MELSKLKKKQKKNFPSDQNKKSHTVSMYNSKKRTDKNGNPPNQWAEIKITQL